MLHSPLNYSYVSVKESLISYIRTSLPWFNKYSRFEDKLFWFGYSINSGTETRSSSDQQWWPLVGYTYHFLFVPVTWKCRHAWSSVGTTLVSADSIHLASVISVTSSVVIAEQPTASTVAVKQVMLTDINYIVVPETNICQFKNIGLCQYNTFVVLRQYWLPPVILFLQCYRYADNVSLFVHFTLLQFTQLYNWAHGYRQWWICE